MLSLVHHTDLVFFTVSMAHGVVGLQTKRRQPQPQPQQTAFVYPSMAAPRPTVVMAQ